jgi:hypothetical protein
VARLARFVHYELALAEGGQKEYGKPGYERNTEAEGGQKEDVLLLGEAGKLMYTMNCYELKEAKKRMKNRVKTPIMSLYQAGEVICTFFHEKENGSE